MRVNIEITDQLIADLAAFKGAQTLTPGQVAELVRATLAEKAAQFVELATDARLASERVAALDAAEERKRQIAEGISVSPADE